MLPVVGAESALDAHGGDVAVSAAISAVAGGGEGVGEASLGEEATYGGEDAAGFAFKDGKEH